MDRDPSGVGERSAEKPSLSCGGSGIRTHGNRSPTAFQAPPVASTPSASVLLNWTSLIQSSIGGRLVRSVPPEFMDKIMDSGLGGAGSTSLATRGVATHGPF
jgi:hypothetical protein